MQPETKYFLKSMLSLTTAYLLKDKPERFKNSQLFRFIDGRQVTFHLTNLTNAKLNNIRKTAFIDFPELGKSKSPDLQYNDYPDQLSMLNPEWENRTIERKGTDIWI